VKFSPLGTHFAVLFPKKIEIYSLSLGLLNTLETKSRYNSILFAEVDLDGLPVEVLCVGTEKGIVEVYDVDIVDIESDDEEEKEEGKKQKGEDDAEDDDDDDEDEEDDEDKPTQVAEVERIGTLVGHTNRYVVISLLDLATNIDTVLIHSESSRSLLFLTLSPPTRL
jgi:hypothetical protein